MKDKNHPKHELDDDGWGEAAVDERSRQRADIETAPTPDSNTEWQDPTNLEKRVAALHEGSKQSISDDPDMTASKQQSSKQQSSKQQSSKQQSSAAMHENTSEEFSEETTSDDAPQWDAEARQAGKDNTTPHSSDMLATADAIAEKKKDPASQKRLQQRKNRERDPKSQLTKRHRYVLWFGALLLVASLVVAVLGWINAKKFYLNCDIQTISATQGDFWPWGTHALAGEAFAPIRGGNLPCQSQQFDSRTKLEHVFIESLLARSTHLLRTENLDQVEEAEKQIQQVLLLTRKPEREKQRHLALRLQGDASYWRGAQKIQTIQTLLLESANHFREAALQYPEQSLDADAWFEHLEHIRLEIDKGPRPLRTDDLPKDAPVFQGPTTPDTTGEQN